MRKNWSTGLGVVVLGLALGGCGSATNNGLAPLPYQPVVLPRAPAMETSTPQTMAPMPQGVQVPEPAPAAPPAITPTPAQTSGSTAIQEEALPLSGARLAPSIASLPPHVAVTPPAVNLPSAPGAVAQAQSALTQARGGLAAHWQQDLQSARTQGARCASLTGQQKDTCWQGVSSWAKERASLFQGMAQHLVGAQAQQAQSAAKFFDVTHQWASACSSISTSACSQSPLISQMQQWKASVGLPASQ